MRSPTHETEPAFEARPGLSLATPVRVDARAGRHEAGPREAGVSTPRVAALIVTWNRRDAVDAVLRALARQSVPRGTLHVVVIDNGSTDGTSEALLQRWHPTRRVHNPTPRAEEPAFDASDADGASLRAGDRTRTDGFASLSLVRNQHNLGGCGGFNTGLAFAERFLDSPDAPLDYVWLVDDDVDLPPNALERLLRTGESDRGIGLVGSRTVDFDDRATTIETTIYYDAQRGVMGPEPSAQHRLAASHAAWVATTGGTNGARAFAGVREVDIVSACSLLARWSAVKDVGFWDTRFFIYCDDADWCLRFAARGHRVVCDLDAVVYHTYWLSKLTPTRAYYAARNLFWVNQKALDRQSRRAVHRRQLAHALLHAYKTAIHGQTSHAEIFRRTADDAVRGRGGALDMRPPEALPLLAAFERADALGADRHVAIMCSHADSIAWGEDVRASLVHALHDAGRSTDLPRITWVCRSDVPRAAPGGGEEPRRVDFAPNAWSKLRLQWWLLRDAPDAVVIIDQCNDAPLLWSRRNILIDRKRAGLAVVERDGWRVRAALALRWCVTAVRCAWFLWRAPAAPTPGKYA